MRKEIVITDKGCFGCPSPCGKYSRMKRYNTNVEGPEYETIGMLGSNLGIADIQDVAQANLLCDDLGIDTISAGSCIGWAMECYEKGILTRADTGGLGAQIWQRRGRVRDDRADRQPRGTGCPAGARASSKPPQQVGQGSEKFAIQVKGMEQSAYATHNATAMLLAYMTCDVGAHHNRSWAITYDLQVGASGSCRRRWRASSGCRTSARCSTCWAPAACSGWSWALTATCTCPRWKPSRASTAPGRTWK